MKGVVFTEFLEMVEERFSAEIADRIIEAADLPSGGAYTAVGTYDHHELLRIVSELSGVTQLPVAQLVRAFGKHLFARFVCLYPQFFEGAGNAFAFLLKIEDHIHVEVRKLYSDAELPRFECHTWGPDQLEMIYRSSRPFGDLAEGLMVGCAEHYREQIRIEREERQNVHGNEIRFLLTREGEAPACRQ